MSNPVKTDSKSEAVLRTGYPQRQSEPPTPTEVAAFLKAYAREKPDVVALWCFGIGFVIGWKLKPW